MWFYFTCVTIILFTILNILQRKIALESSNPRVTAVLFNSVAGIIAFILFLLSGSYHNFHLPTSVFPWILVLVASFCYGMFERGRFYAAKMLDASVLNVLTNVGVFVAFILSLIIFSEQLTLAKIMGAGLILLALVIISYAKSANKISRKGLFIGIVINIIYGITLTLDKMGTRFFTPDTYTIFVWTLPIIFIAFPFVSIKETKKEFKQSSWKIILLATVNITGYFFQLKALSIAPVTMVIPLVQTSVLWTACLAIIFLNERENITKKIIAATLAVIGIYFLV